MLVIQFSYKTASLFLNLKFQSASNYRPNLHSSTIRTPVICSAIILARFHTPVICSLWKPGSPSGMDLRFAYWGYRILKGFGHISVSSGHPELNNTFMLFASDSNFLFMANAGKKFVLMQRSKCTECQKTSVTYSFVYVGPCLE